MRIFKLALVLAALILSQAAAAQAVKDVNVVNNPAVTVENLPAIQAIEGTVDIRQSAARRLVILSSSCSLPAGATQCDVTLPLPPTGTTYIVNRIWNGNFAYNLAANVLIISNSPVGPATRWVESMQQFDSFGNPGSFRLDTEKTLFASSIQIRTIFPSTFSTSVTVPYFVQAEIVPIQ